MGTVKSNSPGCGQNRPFAEETLAGAIGTGWTKKLIDAGYPVTSRASGNMFTYMFGPQVKMHSGKFQPFAEGLFPAAHSNGGRSRQSNGRGPV